MIGDDPDVTFLHAVRVGCVRSLCRVRKLLVTGPLALVPSARSFLKPSAFPDDPLTGGLPGVHRDTRS